MGRPGYCPSGQRGYMRGHKRKKNRVLSGGGVDNISSPNVPFSIILRRCLSFFLSGYGR